jgi:hypothetical protein
VFNGMPIATDAVSQHEQNNDRSDKRGKVRIDVFNSDLCKYRRQCCEESREESPELPGLKHRFHHRLTPVAGQD